MEYFSEEHSKLLLSKEWLTKVDNEKSTPYLLKFYTSSVDLNCGIMITDTKNVWGEVMSSKQFARRWRDCNSLESPSTSGLDPSDEDEWRARILQLISTVHTSGGIKDMSFDVVESRYADFAFELGSSAFKWRWETNAVGAKLSADILSKHLIMPLISVVHLAFSSPAAVSEMSETALEQAVDKLGRTARRTVDTHIRNAVSKPRVATALRRMTAMFNFASDLPPIVSEIDRPDFKVPSPPLAKALISSGPPPSMGQSVTRAQDSIWDNGTGLPSSSKPVPRSRPGSIGPQTRADEESHTEASSGDELAHSSGKGLDVGRISHATSRSLEGTSPPDTKLPEHGVAASHAPPRLPAHAPRPDSSPSSPLRPPKKARRSTAESSSDEDSEDERKRRVAMIKSGAQQRGTKQPLKRGGRRF